MSFESEILANLRSIMTGYDGIIKFETEPQNRERVKNEGTV